MEKELVEVSYLAIVTGSGWCEFLLLHRTPDKTEPAGILIPFQCSVAPLGIFHRMDF